MFFSPARTIINTLGRTAPGIFVYLICTFIMMLSWAIGVQIMLGDAYKDFNNFGSTLKAMLFSDFQLI